MKEQPKYKVVSQSGMFKKRYKLTKKFRIRTGICPSETISLLKNNMNIIIYTGGQIDLFSGFSWDGPSGPTFDTVDSIRASLVHDALCHLSDEGYLPPYYNHIIDVLLKIHCIEDGMNKWRAYTWYFCVRLWRAARRFKRRKQKIRVIRIVEENQNEL